FTIATIREVDFASRLRLIQGLRERAQPHPGPGMAQGLEKAPHPAILITVPVRLGPGTELLAVVGEDDDGIGVLARHPAQVTQGLFRVLEWYQVAHPFAAREDAQQSAVL